MSWTPTVVDLANNITTVKTTSVDVKSVYINTTMSAHACLIKDGATTKFIIPASSVAGTVFDFAGEDGVEFNTNLIVDPDDAGTGNITILYKNKAQ